MTITRRAMVLCAVSSGLLWHRPSLATAEGPPSGRRIALSGYDPVAYFVDGHPEKGSREFWYTFDDVVYLFRSARNRETFVADPEHYAPQYDGYCAGGISEGYKTEPDPEAWLIANGKLYVFTLKDRVPIFKKTIDDVSAKANNNWPQLRKH